MKKIRIATRNSPLALWQAKFVKQELIQVHNDIEVELIGMQTEGDRFLDSSLVNIGGKGLFVKELEEALLKYEGAHDEVTSAGAIFLREAYTRQVIH